MGNHTATRARARARKGTPAHPLKAQPLPRFDEAAYRERYGVDYGPLRDWNGTQSVVGPQLANLSLQSSGPGQQIFRFDTPLPERGGFPAHRERGWAKYDAHSGALVDQGKPPADGWMGSAPTSDEQRAWQAEATHLAAFWQGRLEQAARDDLYIRYGRLPPSGVSVNHATGAREAGVSAYGAQYDLRSGAIHFAEDGTLSGAAIQAALSGRAAYLISGRRLSHRGSDNEPLVTGARIEGILHYDPVLGGFVVSPPPRGKSAS